MTQSKTRARYAALLMGVVVASSCDTRLPTQSGSLIDDVVRPSVKFSLSAGTNNTVELGTLVTVTITATDDQGVALLLTSIRNGALIVGSDSVAMSPSSKTVTRTIPVPLAGLARGDKLTIRATASDASLNYKTDSLIVTIADTTAPVMTIFSSKTGRVVKGGDSLDVHVSASDSSGMQTVGYRVYRTGGADSLTVVLGDSISATSGTSLSASFVRILPAALNIGTYKIVGFAVDKSGVSPNPGPSLTFTVIDGEPPKITFKAPRTGATLNIGDSLLVRVDLHDNVGLKSVTFYGVSPRGDVALGTADTVMRYSAVTAPQGGAVFRAGLTDTLDLKRYLRPVAPFDTIPDKLLVYGVVTDAAGNVTIDTVAIQMTKGPNVLLLAPVVGDSLTRGTKLRITVSATSTAGVAKLGFDVASGGTGPVWPTPIALTSYDTTLATPALKAGPYTVDINIPADAPSKGVLTISPHATDVNGQPGAPTPQDFLVRSGFAPPPLVRQQIASRIEIVDSVLVTVSGTALRTVGYSIHDLATDALVDSNTVLAAASSFGPRTIAFKIATQYQGKKVRIFSFAIDSVGNVGYSVQPNTSTPVTDPLTARRDTSLVVYGQNFILPRAGVAGDFTVDTINGNVFISNTQYNRLERWNASAAAANPSAAFDPTGVSVGSEPWGMVLQSDNDTLLVANSGGTNISKVCISATCGGIGEIGAKRLQTRKLVSFQVTETRDQTTGRIFLSAGDPISYSDRPQYVQQSAGGRVFYSTKPTPFAPAGTIRYLDPKKTVPDPRQVYQYATRAPTTTYAILNSDSIKIAHFPGTNPPSDQLTIYDHVYGDTINPPGITCNGDPHTICGTDSVVVAAGKKVNIQGGDVVARNDVDVVALGLTDTTFVAASGDRTWIGFGEGNTQGTGRVMMVKDSAGTPEPGFFSPGVTVRDLLENASERVFGLGIDLHGANVAVHGAKSYFASLESPFHLRLQGMYDTFNQGSGIAYHPSADMRNGFFNFSKSDPTRTAFVASANGSIEIVDAFNFVSRGTLQVKGNLYGPLRATNRFTTDAPDVVLKLFGLTSQGLVVINLRATDIKDAP